MASAIIFCGTGRSTSFSRSPFLSFRGARLALAYNKARIAVLLASWQNGYATACKAVYAGSIPALASSEERMRRTLR